MSNTQELNPLDLIVAQLGQITKDIHQLPHVIARLEALTESTRQLENTLRLNVQGLHERDEKQAAQIQDLQMRVSGIITGIKVLADEVETLVKKYERDVPVLQRALDGHVAESNPVRSGVDTMIRKVPELERLTVQAVDAFSNLSNRISKFEDAVDKRIAGIEGQLAGGLLQTEDKARLEKCATEFAQWLPWLAGLKWFTMIAGGVIVAGLVVGLLWAAVQSGGFTP